METLTKLNVNEVKKDLYKSKVNAKFSHYAEGKLFYTVKLNDGAYMFPINTVEEYGSAYELSSDLGTTSFENEMKGSDLNRWIAKSIENNEFIKIS